MRAVAKHTGSEEDYVNAAQCPAELTDASYKGSHDVPPGERILKNILFCNQSRGFPS